ncbi:TMV resistance protein N-like [Gastrolobium bilobum]|uniref:TMV resistance protein N-like n=1 Tax=Gastrolobium bilobum TaxID=150636 RepID=UPI002AB25F0C|nr:TMV resistance protein N-like [Gastrolobium bilobum]
MAQPAPSSPFAYTYTYEYDVFLSFRGEDTRTDFTGNLYSALSQRGVLTFIDDDGLQKGEEITPSLFHAIQKSRMAIIVFSKNYASSSFCLNELVQILECYTKQKMWIWPVFYDVDPSEVRHQTGSYGEAFAKHERGRFKDDKVKLQKWRLALNQAAVLFGSHFKHGGEYEHEFIRKIIEVISRKLNRPLLYIANYPVGLEARVEDVHSLIGSKFNDKVNMLGIHGIGGIGKSTIARAVYNLLAYQFEGSCFLANVREQSTRHGLEQIQEKILSELVGERNLSIIIITTRDKHLLDFHGVKKIYEVNNFSDNEAFELFRWNALKNNEVDPSYMEMMKRAIHFARGLPLALEAIGSNLFGKTLDEWESALEACERIPNRDVQQILKVSYDGLEENEKEIFLT